MSHRKRMRTRMLLLRLNYFAWRQFQFWQESNRQWNAGKWWRKLEVKP